MSGGPGFLDCPSKNRSNLGKPISRTVARDRPGSITVRPIAQRDGLVAGDVDGVISMRDLPLGSRIYEPFVFNSYEKA
jgi:hypothetical protein